jgi:hypothetical protein
MQTDNNWLVDKLAEVEEEKSRIMEKSTLDYAGNGTSNGGPISSK